MSGRSPYFEDAAAYDVFMRRWSCAVGDVFLDWIAPPTDACWLDVGCGTGAFTELILDTVSPARVSAVDAAQAQVEYACRHPVGQRAEFQIADARSLPFSDDTFDVVVAALVLNFIIGQSQALAEMCRVGRPGATIAACVWDYASDRSPGSLLRTGLRAIDIELEEVPGTADCGLDALRSLFERAGLHEIATRTIDVALSFASFDELWHVQTLNCGPRAKMLAALSAAERARLIDKVRLSLPADPAGSVLHSARAHAIKAHIPV